MKTTKSTRRPPKPRSKDLPVKVDGRTKNGKKLDLGEVIKLRELHGMSFPDIGRHLGYHHKYVHKAYSKFKELLPSIENSAYYTEHRSALIGAAENRMLQVLTEEEKIKAASLNNVAYAYQQLHNSRRLEEGKSTANIGVSIQAKLAKALEQSNQ